MTLSRLRNGLLTLAMLPALAACGGLDSLADLNPFAERQTPLPGERRSVFADTEATSGAVSIGAEVALTDWAQPGGNPSNNPGHVSASASLTRAWSSSIGTGSGNDRRLSAAPVVQGGIIFTLDAEGGVVASAASNGGRIWRSSIVPEGQSGRGVIGGGLAVGGNGLFVNSPYGEVVAFDASNGQRLWSQNFDISMRGAPTVVDGRVYTIDRNNTLYALNSSDGEIVWSFNTIPETGGLVGSASPAISSGTAVFPLSSGDVVAMNTQRGEPVWTDSLSRTGRVAGFASLQDVSARPVIADGVVYVVGVSGRMLAASLRDGRTVWEQNIASAHMPIVSGNTVFVVTVDGRVMAVDRANGNTRWSQQLDVGTRSQRHTYAGPVLAGGRLYVGTSQGELLVFDPASGQRLTSISIGQPVFIAPIAVNGRVYVLTDNGTLIALQ